MCCSGCVLRQLGLVPGIHHTHNADGAHMHESHPFNCCILQMRMRVALRTPSCPSAKRSRSRAASLAEQNSRAPMLFATQRLIPFLSCDYRSTCTSSTSKPFSDFRMQSCCYLICRFHVSCAAWCYTWNSTGPEASTAACSTGLIAMGRAP